jgi:hypothetical protein
MAGTRQRRPAGSPRIGRGPCLVELGDQSLRRVLRACRIGLAMPLGRPRVASNGVAARAGTDEQLTAKLAAVRAEMERRGMDADDDIEGDGSVPATGYRRQATALDPDWCMVEGCTNEHLRSGLCKAHFLKFAAKGDPEAAAAMQRYRAIHDRHPDWEREYGRPASVDAAHGGQRTPPDFSQLTRGEKRVASIKDTPPDLACRTGRPAERNHEQAPPGQLLPAEPGETKMAKQRHGMNERVKCEKCGREFLANGIGKHQATCKGPDGGKAIDSGQLIVDNGGQARPKRKYTRRGKAVDRGQLTVDSGGQARPKRQYTRRATMAGTPGTRFPVPGSAVSAPIRASAASLIEEIGGLPGIGQAFVRMAELLGLAAQVADFPHMDGHCFVNTQTGAGAMVTLDGEIRAIDVLTRPKL